MIQKLLFTIRELLKKLFNRCDSTPTEDAGEPPQDTHIDKHKLDIHEWETEGGRVLEDRKKQSMETKEKK